MSPTLAKSLLHNLFADPHPLTLATSTFYKNSVGRGAHVFLDLQLSTLNLPGSLSPLPATLMDLHASAASKRLTISVTPLASTLTKNRGSLLQAKCFSHSHSPIFRTLFQVDYPMRIVVLSESPAADESKDLSGPAQYPVFRTLFQVPYSATPLFATLTKTAGVCTNNSHSGTHLAGACEPAWGVSSRCFPFNLQLSTVNLFTEGSLAG